MKDPKNPSNEVDDEFDEHWSQWDDWQSEHPKEYFRQKARARIKAKAEVDPNQAAEPIQRQGLVILVGSKICDVKVDEEIVRCVVPRKLAAKQRAELAVGDEVVFSPRDEGDDIVVEVLPRRSELSRPDPLNPHKQRVLAANVDLVIATLSVVAPPLKPGLVDRIALACARGGSQVAVFVNKIDLLEDADPEVVAQEQASLALLEAHKKHGISVLLGSADEGQGIAELKELTAGKTVVLVGHSGVGKSSLMSELLPDVEFEVQEVREKDGLGRHTTTQASVHFLEGGTRLIDTPGVRQFGLWDLDPRDLRLLFPEFQSPELSCKFQDCTHIHEPQCGVLAARGTELVPEERYKIYLELLESMHEKKQTSKQHTEPV